MQLTFFNGFMILIGMGLTEDKEYPEIVVKTQHRLELLSLKNSDPPQEGKAFPKIVPRKPHMLRLLLHLIWRTHRRYQVRL